MLLSRETRMGFENYRFVTNHNKFLLKIIIVKVLLFIVLFV